MLFNIGPKEPSQLAINENANELDRDAITCRDNDMVQAVEPETVVMALLTSTSMLT